MKSNFFNPNQMISNTSQKIVMGVLYSTTIGLILFVGLLSFSIIDIGVSDFISILLVGIIVIIVGVGIWLHEVSKPC